jgi:hypothetical protein
MSKILIMKMSLENETVTLLNGTIMIVPASHLPNVDASQMFCLIALSVIFVLSFVLNFISISSIIRARAFTPINVLIMNLALADVTYILGIPLLVAQILNQNWYFGQLGCVFFMVTEFFGVIGVLTVMALSVLRYLDVTGFSKRFLKSYKLFIIIVYCLVTWPIAVALALPILFSIHLAKSAGQVFSCESKWSETSLKEFFTIKFLLFCLIPFIVIAVSSFKLVLFLNKKRQTLQEQTTHAFNSKNLLADKSEFGTKTGSARCSITPNDIMASGYLSEKSKPCSIENELNEMTSKCDDKLIIHELSSSKRQILTVTITKASYTQCVRQKANRLILSIVFFILLQSFPFCIFHFIMLFAPKVLHNARLIHLVVCTLSYSNTITNPLVYMLLTNNFKKYCRK